MIVTVKTILRLSDANVGKNGSIWEFWSSVYWFYIGEGILRETVDNVKVRAA